MGQASGKAFVIEFNGIPGSGKTTTAFEMKKKLKAMQVSIIPLEKVRAYQESYKEIISSKDKRDIFIIFLKMFFLIRPITWERWRYMKITFNHWLGVKKISTKKSGICIVDQGIVQGFVSMAYQGTIGDEGRYCKYIGQIMDRLDNIICVNCDIDVDSSNIRMRTRKSHSGRLDQIKKDKKLNEVLLLQKSQFEKIRKKSIKYAITINMNDKAEYNAEKIIEYCFGNTKKYVSMKET